MRIFIFIFLMLAFANANAQRTYATNSVLASGNWYKLGVKEAGVYKVDIAFLTSLGINTSNISSNSIRLFGNGGQMLPEPNSTPRIDDLFENAIQVFDGGDGVFNGSDYFLFFANGPDTWAKDSVNQKFRHEKNLYSNQSFYFLQIGGNGKRMATRNSTQSPNITVRNFDDRFFYETDTINFLGSGKEWFGEEFSSNPGGLLVRNFSLPLNNLVSNTNVQMITNLAARSVGANSRFDVRLNNNVIQQINMFAVQGGALDLFAYNPEQQTTLLNAQPNLQLSFSFVPGTFNAQGWLNWFEVFAKRNISMTGNDQLLFRDWSSVATNNMASFVVQNANANTIVWDVTNPLEPLRMQGNLSGTDFVFQNAANQLREYVAFNGANFLRPTNAGVIGTQNLHNSFVADFIIVTHPDFQAQAQRLAQFHLQQYGQRVAVANTTQIYNEFGSGSPDPTAIRDYVKMFYDKAASNTSNEPKYLLLFGDASFDYKTRINGNTNFVPCYESPSTLDPLSTYTSDDFFGMLDFADDVNAVAPASLIDIGIGRIPIAKPEEAKTVVDKIIAYHQTASLGVWRNQLTFVADDEDGNLHLNDAEIISLAANNVNNTLNQNKIYLDAFRQESGSGGSRYPAANQAIINQMFKGNLIWNYSGHGGYKRLSEEAILDQDVVNQFNNENRLPMFITATCDFAPYDNPTLQSLGEELLIKDKKGAIALMTTTRVVFAFSNRVMNNNYLNIALQKDTAEKYLFLGDAVRKAKNYTYQSSGDIINNRKFTLIGDPAMKLGYPEWKVKTLTLNNRPIAGSIDSLKALGKYVITGEVTDERNNPLPNFSGTIYPTVFDKVQQVQTLGNDPGSPPIGFPLQNSIVFKGAAKVINGKFSFEFLVPKDINYQFGNARISYYADNGAKDANGIVQNIIIGGASTNITADNDGPSISAFLNDEKFVNGGLVGEQNVLLLKLIDSSGINTLGAGIGHDITAILDEDVRNVFVLNDFYQGELDNFKKGTIRFQLPKLENGPHRLKIKAWDAANNSTEVVIEFIVQQSSELSLNHVLNYPNPFTTKTQFWFEHNQPAVDLKVMISVLTVTGKLVKQLRKTINTSGNRFCELEWDGSDDFGNKLARGVYLYQLTVSLPTGESKTITQKLYIL
jgi:hypothetical protein